MLTMVEAFQSREIAEALPPLRRDLLRDSHVILPIKHRGSCVLQVDRGVRELPDAVAARR